MPVIINGVLRTPNAKKAPGRPSYNAKIIQLIPAIQEARKNGHHGVEEIAQHLNTIGHCAPSGRKFSYTTMHLILSRLGELGRIDGPRSVGQAVSARPYTPRLSGRRRRIAMTPAGKAAMAEFERAPLASQSAKKSQ